MNQSFLQVPKLNFIHNKDELKPEKEDISTLEFINKKRKLSENSSDEGSTNTRKESLNDSFTCMNNNSTTPLKNTSSDFSVNIPKPIRPGPGYSNKKYDNSGATNNNNNYNENQKLVDKLLKMQLNDLKPITDFLQKHQDMEKKAEIPLNNNKDDINKSKQNSDQKLANDKFSFPLFYFPFGVPLGKTSLSEFLQQNFEDLKKSQSQTPSVHFVGPLTLEERAQKVNRYLEKKKKRKWKYVRYNIRKDLADQRQRVQGRFVKTNKIKFPFLLNEPRNMCDSYNEELKTGVSFMQKSNNSM